MDIVDLILQSQGEDGLKRIGGQFGLDEAQTQTAMETLAPALAAGVRRNMASPEGMAGLFKALAGGGHARYLDEPDALDYETVKPEGDAILGHVLGSKDVSRTLALQAAGSTGIPGSVLKKMLPVIAPLVLGALFKMFTGSGRAAAPSQDAPETSSGGGLGDLLGKILTGGQGSSSSGSSGGGVEGMIRDVLGGGSSEAKGGDSSSGGGLEDMLRDVLGGGSSEAQGEEPSSGGGLDGMIRDVLGGGGEEQEASGDDTFGRGRDILEDMLGRGTARGDAGEELLKSVERRLRGM